MSQRQPDRAHWTPAWTAAVAALAAAAVVEAEQLRLLPVQPWGFPFIAVAGALVTALVLATQGAWLAAHLHSALTWAATGAWVTWASVAGWTPWVWLTLVVAPPSLAAFGHVCRTPDKPTTVGGPLEESGDRRPREVREWEALLRGKLKGAKVVVTAVMPWTNPDDGANVHVDLPADGSLEPEALIAAARGLAVARRLPKGCTISVSEGEHQGEVVLSVMLRDCLSDSVELDDDYSPASVYDDFRVMTGPQGEALEVCLRHQSMVIGGAPDSGKTTLLHRIIMFLARCVDCLIWVVDANGGGVAEPWVRPWAMGKAARPVVDWVATDEDEAAVLVAVATAIAKDRKSSPEATRRRHEGDTTVLPVDAHLPAIVVLNDEGGEMRQAVSALGQIADAGISRLAQIGRAEGVRAIKSVLRGTADLLDKGLRVCAALRICLRMEEADEYVHVLGKTPPKAQLLDKGRGFITRPGDLRPLLGRTVNVLLSQIEAASIACADLRPDLDERARQVAARIRPRDVLGGRNPDGYPDLMDLQVMRDVAAGRAYEGRWERAADWLASMRGEDLRTLDEPLETPPTPAAPTPSPAALAPEGSAFARFLTATGVNPEPVVAQPAADPTSATTGVDLDDQDQVDQEAARLLGAVEWQTGEPVVKLTAREHVLAILGDMYPHALTSAEIGVELERREVELSRGHRHEVLAQLVKAGLVSKVGATYAKALRP
jgi:hypothetical protein